MNPYDEIRRRVSCVEAARWYGFAPNRGGFICCPFHHERTPSLKVYDGERGFFCFGCHKGGDVIELVSELLGVSRTEAAQDINRSFSLGLTFGRDRETPEQRREREERKRTRERGERIGTARIDGGLSYTGYVGTDGGGKAGAFEGDCIHSERFFRRCQR